MKDRDFLIWLHDRLNMVHGESETLAHMHKLRAIIRAIDCDTETPATATWSSLDELLDQIAWYW